MNKNYTNLSKSILFSVGAQAMSLFVNLVLGLILPKFISEYQYAYWQTYVLYVGYVGLLHLGLLDGILLRYSQYNYEDLDKPILRSQFVIMNVFNLICSVTVICLSLFFLTGELQIVGILVGIGIVTKNMFTYSYYLLQSTNRIDKYSLFIISHKLMYSSLVLFFLIMGKESFVWFCIADLIGDLTAIILIGFRYNKGLYYGKTCTAHVAFECLGKNILAGALLLIANCSAQLLIGSAKMIVQWRWDEIVFSKVSFSFSLANLFLAFVQAISIVLFPTLKRTDKKELADLYKNIRRSITPILFGILILYYPGYLLLRLWLPAYEPSLKYLGFLLPIIIFTSKVNLLTNNYLKAYRNEMSLFVINVLSVIIAFSAFYICAYGFNNLIYLLICAVFVIVVRSIVSEMFVMKIIGISFYKEFLVEILITILFVCSTQLLPLVAGFFMYLTVFVVYIFIRRIKCDSIN